MIDCDVAVTITFIYTAILFLCVYVCVCVSFLSVTVSERLSSVRKYFCLVYLKGSDDVTWSGHFYAMF